MLSSCLRTRPPPAGARRPKRRVPLRYGSNAAGASIAGAPQAVIYAGQHWNRPESGMTLPRCTDTVWRSNPDGSSCPAGDHAERPDRRPAVKRRKLLAVAPYRRISLVKRRATQTTPRDQRAGALCACRIGAGRSSGRCRGLGALIVRFCSPGRRFYPVPLALRAGIGGRLKVYLISRESGTKLGAADADLRQSPPGCGAAT
jgi:hypothetical protein